MLNLKQLLRQDITMDTMDMATMDTMDCTMDTMDMVTMDSTMDFTMDTTDILMPTMDTTMVRGLLMLSLLLMLDIYMVTMDMATMDTMDFTMDTMDILMPTMDIMDIIINLFYNVKILGSSSLKWVTPSHLDVLLLKYKKLQLR